MYVYGDQLNFASSTTATSWEAEPDGRILVVDGIGDGSKPFEDTGFMWVPNQWHKFTQLVDYPNKTWRFFMDDEEYLAPDELGFRGNPPMPLDGINILSASTDRGDEGVYMDELRISAIPEPSTLALLVMGAV